MKSKQINHIYGLLALVDETVAKAFGISEVAKIAKTEKRLRELFFKQWEIVGRRATKKAGSMAKSGKSPIQVRNAIKKDLQRWRRIVSRVFLDELEYIYRLARVAAYKKATGKTQGSLQYDTETFGVQKVRPIPRIRGLVFDLADDAAIKAIQEQQTFWIGEFIDGFSEAIEEITREVVLETGESYREAGRILQEKIEGQFEYIKIPEGFVGTAEKYFEGLAANAATVARAHGQLTSFMEVDAKAFIVVNPMDERTCQRCSALDGMEFPIEQGVAQMRAEQVAGSIDEMKAAHPWLTTTEILNIKNNNAEKVQPSKFARAGVILPPYHFRCRCTIDIA